MWQNITPGQYKKETRPDISVRYKPPMESGTGWAYPIGLTSLFLMLSAVIITFNEEKNFALFELPPDLRRNRCS
jgi:hypothetical protein